MMLCHLPFSFYNPFLSWVSEPTSEAPRYLALLLFFSLFCFARIARELGEFRFKGISRMGDGRYVAMGRRETALLEIG